MTHRVQAHARRRARRFALCCVASRCVESRRIVCAVCRAVQRRFVSELAFVSKEAVRSRAGEMDRPSPTLLERNRYYYCCYCCRYCYFEGYTLHHRQRCR